jgi:hypothetical protein
LQIVNTTPGIKNIVKSKIDWLYWNKQSQWVTQAILHAAISCKYDI